MRQDVAILCYKYNTIATKPVSGPLLEGEAAHYPEIAGGYGLATG
jgi:hypothetical protein